MRRLLAWSDGIVAAGFAALIIVLSLYPFSWRVPADGAGPLATLAASWAKLSSPGDILANLVFYAPLGFFGALAQRRGMGWRRLVPVLLFALALSLGCELTQYYIAQRQTSASDVYANALGALCGAAVALALGRDYRSPILRGVAADLFPALLLIAWLASRLFPHIEAAWAGAAASPMPFLPVLTAYGLFRYAVAWLAVIALLDIILAGKAWRPALALCAALVLGVRLRLPLEPVTLAEPAGILLAALAWPALGRMAPPRRAALLAILFCLLLVAARLEPFIFVPHGRPFGWLPFRSLVRGPDTIAVEALLAKFFLYGGALWLLVAAGMRPSAAALLVALLLLLASLVETHIPWRSAESTDAVLALMFAALRVLVRRGEISGSSPGRTPP